MNFWCWYFLIKQKKMRVNEAERQRSIIEMFLKIPALNDLKSSDIFMIFPSDRLS